MKKTIVMILCMMCILASMAGCSGNKEINVQQAATALIDSSSYAEQLSPVDSSVFAKKANIDESLIEDASVYMGSAAIVDTVAVIKTSDTAAVEAALKAYIDELKAGYSSYRPDEVPKLDDCTLTTAGDYVVLCISSDASAGKKAVDTVIK